MLDEVRVGRAYSCAVPRAYVNLNLRLIIYSLRPVSIRGDSAQRKTNLKSEATHFVAYLPIMLQKLWRPCKPTFLKFS